MYCSMGRSARRLAGSATRRQTRCRRRGAAAASVGDWSFGPAIRYKRKGARIVKIAVIALGKIGLPLAVQFASKGHEVVGVDVNRQVVDLINAGIEPFPGEARLQEQLSA